MDQRVIGDEKGKELEKMLFNLNPNFASGFQPNSPSGQNFTGFIAGGFMAAMHPSNFIPMVYISGSAISPRLDTGLTRVVEPSGRINGGAQQQSNRKGSGQWDTGNLIFTNKITGKLNSRSDGLPHSPLRQPKPRGEKEGGITRSY